MKDKRVTEPPYFVSSDDAEDCPDHRHSGLAKVDTGRTSDWPVARLCEWPTAQFIATACNSHEALVEALKETTYELAVLLGEGHFTVLNAQAALKLAEVSS